MRVCCFLGQNIAKGHGKQNGKCVFYDRIQQQRAMDNKAENGLFKKKNYSFFKDRIQQQRAKEN